eukprot:TRINITY_DN2927_c5_g1::TRINITY_DN2927_c5_g1_i2::g.4634::m.4634 TRINITY_DN2927_c5_g1::TRINITY_DN2927_c5_g1_i2::g.4634  ORF type:complete len:544 (+),score=120.41,sp/Q8W117/SMU1_ARATH/60.67/0.0,WD40/PF00400.27/0.0034,WD40/PF00400.27/3.6e-07,WD40/PF00400.27/4.4e-07,WD40/PF00400.27/2e-11,WD40/PF00400.27/0.0031,Nup160/PF11715.3/6.2e+02,Nup160/PF11715.3/0.027,Nup160/PF11715.3/0.00044,PQQ_2/PF13360.1/0.011,Nucleoporin_N/PF08801.6/1.3e+02,Nucleoporin_N/PF08801.6/15,Nucleoporin_N/PF08801.6/1.3,PQQ_3/PF135
MATLDATAENIEIEARDVIKLVLQFCKENSLFRTLTTLQNESKVALNIVDSVEQFVADINNGHWDSVLKTVENLQLPDQKLFDLYEQMITELIELRELDTARAILRETEPMHKFKREQPDTYLRLEQLLARPYFTAKEAYRDGESKERRRAVLAQSLSAEVAVVPPSRLLTVLGHALKWYRHQGLLPPGTTFDIFRGSAPVKLDEEEIPPKVAAKTIKFAKNTYAEVAAFSPDGVFFVTGSVDGFIEVWDPATGKLNKDLKYQAEDAFMMHDTSILCLAFSRDSDMLASGCQDGKLKIWKVRTGQVLRRFEAAHSQGVTCVAFARDGTQVLSGSFDTTVRIHGLKSGKLIREFRGHASFVNACDFSTEGNRVITASSDGSVRVWDAKTTDCLQVIKPPQPGSIGDISVNTFALMPMNNEQIVICNKSNNLYQMTLQGALVKVFSGDRQSPADFVDVVVSPKGDWIYALTSDSNLVCFNVRKGEVDSVLKAHDKEGIGIFHHPHRNFIATWSDDGTAKLWTP